MTGNPKALHEGQSLLSHDEAQQLLEWGQSTAQYSSEQCLHQLFEAQVKAHPLRSRLLTKAISSLTES